MQDIFAYNDIARELRYFFQEKQGFVEVPPQPHLSILTVCENPKTVVPFQHGAHSYPLPQTAHSGLEAALLKNPRLPGVFCISTSYRNEPHPLPGRHDNIFPLFEFGSHGTIDDLRQLESDLLAFLGFSSAHHISYESQCAAYRTPILEAAHEKHLQKAFGDVISLEYFPTRTHPFWNIKQGNPETYHKINVLLHGVPTIGSAERSCDTKQMRDNFCRTSGGEYAEFLFKTFGEKRVRQELEAYLAQAFFPRFGGGIGITRLARAMKLAGLIETANTTSLQTA